MDFARKQLEKYGWTDGKGLGKNENGISQPLKPKLKRSTTGVGHDAASEFTEHWWTTLYNKAAGNVQVTEKNGKTKKIKANSDDFVITNSTWKLSKTKKNTEEEQYADYFVKKATLTNGGVKMERVKESDSESEGERKDVLKMTDEELFAACEGRTAHKGARHGLKALGKLARIEKQEQMLLTHPQYEGYSHSKKIESKNKLINKLQVEDLNLNSDTDAPKIKKKKKKKHCLHNKSITESTNDFEMAESAEPVPEKIKKKRKVTDDNVASEEIEECGRKSKKSKCANESNTSDDLGCLFKSKKKKKKLNEKVNFAPCTEEETTNFLKTEAKYEFLDNGVVRKTKKKNKKQK